MAVAGWKKMKRLDQVKPSEEEIEFIFEIIDFDGDGKITLAEATKSAQLLKDRFGVTEVKVKYVRFTFIHLFSCCQVKQWMRKNSLGGCSELSLEQFKQSVEKMEWETAN